jgi:soluble lytic murein transglycosylase-like protein
VPYSYKVTTQDKVAAAAAAYEVPIDLAQRLARQESGFDQSRVSSAGAIGVMQLMPGTAAELGVDPHDEDQNIEGGMRYLRQMFDRFGNWNQAVAAYNAGPGRIAKVIAGVQALPAETANYVKKILGAPFQLLAGSDSSSSDISTPMGGQSGTVQLGLLIAVALIAVAIVWFAV